jgi:hypothetical protein
VAIPRSVACTIATNGARRRPTSPPCRLRTELGFTAYEFRLWSLDSHVFASPSLAVWRTPPFRVPTHDSQRDEDAPDRMIVSAEASTDSRSSFQ